MVARGLKRKLHVSNEGGGPGWENQLQSVLDISLDKFQRDQALVEPSLLRSVLINNTLRQVQSEVRTSMTATNICWKPQTSAGAQPEQECIPPVHSASLGEEDVENDFMAWSTEEDFSLSSAISTILKNLDAVLDGGYSPSGSQCSPLTSVENITRDGKLKPSMTFSNKMESYSRSEVGISGGMSGFLQNSTIDDLLMDFDTSVFDGEVNSFGPRAFSFPSDEFVRCLPSPSSSLSKPPSSSSREVHEFEHIMDLLIRS